jgi:hypothetical protein
MVPTLVAAGRAALIVALLVSYVVPPLASLLAPLGGSAWLPGLAAPAVPWPQGPGAGLDWWAFLALLAAGTINFLVSLGIGVAKFFADLFGALAGMAPQPVGGVLYALGVGLGSFLQVALWAYVYHVIRGGEP